MKILVTSGGTREPIDDVRVLTNISSGQLGAMIADEALRRFHDVVYIHGLGAMQPLLGDNPMQALVRTVPVRDTASLMAEMERHVPDVDAVVHAMAVSDFTFERDNPVKLSSSDAEGFIEFMRANIRPTPKVLDRIREWSPEVFLVSFKFEVGRSTSELVHAAMASGKRADSDWVFANDKVEMERERDHVGYLVSREGAATPLHGKQEIARAIVQVIENDTR